MQPLFTEENSRLAALVHGDPNEVHINNRFGITIAPGLMQLQGFLALQGWNPGHAIDVKLEKPVVVPNKADYKSEFDDSSAYVLSDDETIYSRASAVKSENAQNTSNAEYLSTYSYELTNEQVLLDSLYSWKSYCRIPLNLVSQIVPRTGQLTLDRAAAVGVSANAFVKALRDNPDFLPDLFFPRVRESGQNAVLEDRIVLYMGNAPPGKKTIELGVHLVKQNPDNKKSLIATVSETSGLYKLEIYFTKIPLKIFPRLLKRV